MPPAMLAIPLIAPPRLLRVAAVLFALIVLSSASATARRVAPIDAAASRALRVRAAELFERRQQARLEGGIPMDDLQRDLVTLAAELEAAGLDSVAAAARYRAAGVLSRLSRSSEAEQQLTLSVAAALRARYVRQELASRVSLAQAVTERDPMLGIEAVHALVPRLQADHFDAGLGDARATEARAWMEVGRWREALAAAKRASQHYRRAGVRRLEANANVQCSQALRFLGRYEEALALTDSVIAFGRRETLGPTLSRALLERSSMFRAMDRSEEALAAADQALEVDRRRGDLRGVRASRLFRASLLLDLRRTRACLAEVDSLRREWPANESRATLVRITAMHAQALLESGRPLDADSLLARELPAFEHWRASLASDEDRVAVADHFAAVYSVWARSRLVQSKVREAWVVHERGRASSLEGRVNAPDVPAIGPLLAKLGRAHAALLQYDVLDARFGCVFLLTGDGVEGFALPGDVRASDVRAAVAALSSGHASRTSPALQKLSAGLLASVWPRLPRDVQRLIVVPPFKANTLPWEALPVPGSATGERLGDRLAVSYVPSAGVLVALEARRPEGRGLTVLADPQLEAATPALASLEPAVRGSILRGLPGARAEAKRLAEPGATMLLGRDATIERLLAAPPAGVLHLATHAIEDKRTASRGGLVLAGREALLTPGRIEGLGIAADLVTLSGCRTLGSVEYRGEGAYGLARSFLVGGARTVVTTRWDVGDRAAERFMQAFYDALRAGLERDLCLARAQQALLRERFPPRDVWAFQLIGVPDGPVERWAGAGANPSR